MYIFWNVGLDCIVVILSQFGCGDPASIPILINRLSHEWTILSRVFGICIYSRKYVSTITNHINTQHVEVVLLVYRPENARIRF